MWTIDRSADLPLCGEGATVERSHRHERRMRARNAWLSREGLYVGNDWAAAARTSGTRYSECSHGGTLSTRRDYSEYSKGVV